MFVAQWLRKKVESTSSGRFWTFGLNGGGFNVSENFLDGCLGRETVLFPQNVHGAVFDKLVGPPDANDLSFDAGIIEMLNDAATESIVKDMILHRADDIGGSGEEFDGARIERLDPAGIDYGG